MESKKIGRATLKWDMINNASGYQLWISKEIDGNYSIAKVIQNGSASSYTKCDLESGATYYFKMRAYAELDGKKVFGTYSNVKSVEIK